MQLELILEFHTHNMSLYDEIIQGANNYFADTTQATSSPADTFYKSISRGWNAMNLNNLSTSNITENKTLKGLESIIGAFGNKSGDGQVSNGFNSIIQNIAGKDGQGFQNLFSKGGFKDAIGGLKGGVKDMFKGSGGKANAVGLAASAINMGLDALGVEKTDARLSTWGDKGLALAQNIPGPVGWIATGLNLISNRTGEATAVEHTKGLDTRSYNIDSHAMASSENNKVKNSGLSRLFNAVTGKRGRVKEISSQIKGIDERRLLSSNINYQNDINNLASTNSLAHTNQKNQYQLFGGLSTNAIAAKRGAKISRSQLGFIIRTAERNVKHLKNGGTLEKTNIIPEGAFHSRKHNLPEEIAEHVTPKGIPIIVKEGGEIKQVAEIEKNEIIFNKEVSEKIEDYLRDFNEAKTSKEKDKIAIECGKLITHEIINNTIDKTGLLEKEYD